MNMLSLTSFCFCINCTLDSGQPLFVLRIVRVQLETRFISIMSSEKIAQTMHSGSLTAPSLGPVWLELYDFICIIERTLVVLLRGISGRSIRVKNVVVWVNFDCLRELLSMLC